MKRSCIEVALCTERGNDTTVGRWYPAVHFSKIIEDLEREKGERDLKITWLGNKQTTPPKKNTKTTAEDPSGIRLCGREGSKFLSSQPGRGSSPAPPALSNRAAPALRPSAAAPERTDSERHRRPSSPPSVRHGAPGPQPQPLPSGGTDRARSAAPAAGSRPGAGAALYSRLTPTRRSQSAAALPGAASPPARRAAHGAPPPGPAAARAAAARRRWVPLPGSRGGGRDWGGPGSPRRDAARAHLPSRAAAGPLPERPARPGEQRARLSAPGGHGAAALEVPLLDLP